MSADTDFRRSGRRTGAKTSIYLPDVVKDRWMADGRSLADLVEAGLDSDWSDAPVRMVQGRLVLVSEELFGRAAARARAEGASVVSVIGELLRWYGNYGDQPEREPEPGAAEAESVNG